LGKGALVGDAMVKFIFLFTGDVADLAFTKGLGKTLTMIALVVATKKEKSPNFSRATLIGMLLFLGLGHGSLKLGV
jgi:multisubunit Na+/H+ antiporter MnhB subunit